MLVELLQKMLGSIWDGGLFSHHVHVAPCRASLTPGWEKSPWTSVWATLTPAETCMTWPWGRLCDLSWTWVKLVTSTAYLGLVNLTVKLKLQATHMGWWNIWVEMARRQLNTCIWCSKERSTLETDWSCFKTDNKIRSYHVNGWMVWKQLMETFIRELHLLLYSLLNCCENFYNWKKEFTGVCEGILPGF